MNAVAKPGPLEPLSLYQPGVYPEPLNNPEGEELKRVLRASNDPLSFAEYIYGPRIPFEIGTEAERKCLAVRPVVDPVSHKAFKDWLDKMKNMVGIPRGTTWAHREDTLAASQFIQEAVKNKPAEAQHRLCRPELEAQTLAKWGKFGVTRKHKLFQVLVAFETRRSRGALLGHHYFRQISKPKVPVGSDHIQDVSWYRGRWFSSGGSPGEVIEWHQSRWFLSLAYPFLATLLVQVGWCLLWALTPRPLRFVAGFGGRLLGRIFSPAGRFGGRLLGRIAATGPGRLTVRATRRLFQPVLRSPVKPAKAPARQPGAGKKGTKKGKPKVAASPAPVKVWRPLFAPTPLPVRNLGTLVRNNWNWLSPRWIKPWAYGSLVLFTADLVWTEEFSRYHRGFLREIYASLLFHPEAKGEKP